MTDHGFALFETAVGPCGVAWSRDGILGVQLPEGDATRTRARLRRRFPHARETEAPEPVRSAVGAIQALLSGEPRDLSQVALDWTGVGGFERRVYEVARAIRPGATLTYGEVAARIGETALAARDVGQALGRSGKSGGFSARGGAATKLKLLRIEGADAAGPPTLFD